jgi:ribosomal protein L9
VDESNEDQVLKSEANSTVEVLSASNVSQSKSPEVLGAVNPESSAAEPVLKSSNVKVVKMNVKYKWTTKKIGKYKIKAHLWKVRYAYGYHNYLDILS